MPNPFFHEETYYKQLHKTTDNKMKNKVTYFAILTGVILAWMYIFFCIFRSTFWGKSMTEKLDLRVKLNTETHLLLDAYIEQSGTTKSQVVSDLIWGNLPNRLACLARVFLTKYHNNNIYSQGDPIQVKPKARGKTYLPDDFSLIRR